MLLPGTVASNATPIVSVVEIIGSDRLPEPISFVAIVRPAPLLSKYPTRSFVSRYRQRSFQCAPIDAPDFRYLNHSHAPLPQCWLLSVSDVAQQ
jgi:hypothetical protein